MPSTQEPALFTASHAPGALPRPRLATAVSSLLVLVIACGVSACGFVIDAFEDDGVASPTVLSTTPVPGATEVALDGSVTATFSEAMEPTTLTASTFTLTSDAVAVPIEGTVSYAGATAVFRPTAELARDGVYTATITTGASNDAGVPLAAAHTWSFTGESLGAGGLPVTLGTAGDYVVLAKASISGTGATITGDLGISPAAASSVTGFSLIADASTQFSTSAQITGRVYAADYGVPTPTRVGTAVSDMQLAYAAAAARPAGVIALGTGNIGGRTLAPGVYRWTTGVTILADVTLAGRASDVWIFQIAGTLDVAAATRILLAGGARTRNVFWQTTGAVTLGATAHLEGVVLAATALTGGAGTTITGRVLSQTDVTITGSTVVPPSS